MKFKILVAAAAIGLGAMMLPGAGEAASIATMPVVTAAHNGAVIEARMVCHWRRVWIRHHRNRHGRWIHGHWAHRRFCHHM
ncbi:MAG: hypothetical protein ACREFD_18275 [Stellaceae bacterium]